MSMSSYEEVVEQVKALSLTDQVRLRAMLDVLLAPPLQGPGVPMTEDEIEQDMVRAGELEVPKGPVDIEAFRSYKPIDLKGRPLVSETLIEERR
jgi:hypothetical protein